MWTIFHNINQCYISNMSDDGITLMSFSLEDICSYTGEALWHLSLVSKGFSKQIILYSDQKQNINGDALYFYLIFQT